MIARTPLKHMSADPQSAGPHSAVQCRAPSCCSGRDDCDGDPVGRPRGLCERVCMLPPQHLLLACLQVRVARGAIQGALQHPPFPPLLQHCRMWRSGMRLHTAVGRSRAWHAWWNHCWLFPPDPTSRQLDACLWVVGDTWVPTRMNFSSISPLLWVLPLVGIILTASSPRADLLGCHWRPVG